MYFDNFPGMMYDFPVNSDGSNKLISVADVTRNVRFKKEFIDNLNIYELYRMQDGETIEMVSEKVYGSPAYHWILMILNQRYDYIEDFPLSVSALDVVLERKYSSRKLDVKFYTDSEGTICNGEYALTLENTPDENIGNVFLFDKIMPGHIIKRQTAIGDYLATIDSITEDGKFNVTMHSGKLEAEDEVSIYSYYDQNGVFVEELIGETTILTASLGINLNVVTNYEYEMMKNEEKRIIKILPRSYLDQIVNEFESLINS